MLDKHGWAVVDELLVGINRTYSLAKTELIDVVESDESQRFSLNADQTLIRANQWHSVPVDTELNACVPPEYLYYEAGQIDSDHILAQGISPCGCWYVSLNEKDDSLGKESEGNNQAQMIVIRSGQLWRNGQEFFLMDNGVWLTSAIPPEYLAPSVLS